MRRLAALLGLLLVLACAVNPVTGDREFLIVSPEEEAETGRRAAEQVTREIGLVTDAALAEYVAAIGRRVSAFSPRSDVAYSFWVVDMPESNAFALPGGYVYVSRGLLALTNSEDELANVIAHEVGHVAARHHAQRQTRATSVGLASLLGTIAAAALGGPGAASAAGQLGQVAGAGLIASYSRDQERQSDQVGQKMAAEAGWDPAAMVEFLESLGQETQLRTGKTRQPTFLDSHPSTPERIHAAAALARTLPRRSVAPIAASRAEFLRRLDGLLVGPDPDQGVLRDAVFLHPGLDFQIRFPAAWEVHNSPTSVAARAPDRSALVRLAAQGEGSDPGRAAQAFARESGVELVGGGRTRINGLYAWRARATAETQSGSMFLELTWIAHRGLMFRIEAATSPQSFSRFEALFARTAKSFRPLTAQERASIRQRKLAIVAARRGETLAALTERTGNAWSVHETAVMNGLHETDRLSARQAIKIVRDEPYTRGR